jgi:hypothetical protein
VCVSLKGARWKLIKESGRLPDKCGNACCGACDSRRCERVEARSYVVLKCHGTFVWPLCNRSITRVVDSVLPSIEEALRRDVQSGSLHDRQRSTNVATVAAGLREAAFYGKTGCRRSFRAELCIDSKCVNDSHGSFLMRDCFSGLYPLGEGHWFTGVTDAGGLVGSHGLPWLMCWEGICWY